MNSRKKRATKDANIAQELRQLRSRSARIQRGVFYAEGNRIVAQAAQSGAEIVKLICAPEIVTSDLARQTLAEMRAANAPIVELTKRAFNQISFRRNPSGMGAIIRGKIARLEQVEMGGLGWVALDGVGNAGNLGAIFRSCDAVGCRGVILLGDTADPYHPDAVRASMGAIFWLKLASASFADFAAWKKTQGHVVIGAAGDAPYSYRAIHYPQPAILLMGSERLGLTPAQQAICDTIVNIPMAGSGDSLNLAVATSLILYEIYHQHSQFQ